MYQASLSAYSASVFFGKADGRLNFEFYPEVIAARARDIVAMRAFKQFPSLQTLQSLFSTSDPAAIETLSLGQDMSGEWFNKVKIGFNVKIGNNFFAMAHGGITVGNGVHIGHDVMVVTNGHGSHCDQRYLNRYGHIIIGDNVTIEDGVLLAHPTNGTDLVIPAGSVIKKGSLIMRPHDIEAQGRNPGVAARAFILEQDSHAYTIVKHDDVDDLRARLGIQDLMFLPPVYIGGEGKVDCGINVLFNNASLVLAQGHVSIGSRTFLAPKGCVYAPEESAVHIGESVWVGAGATIEAPKGQTIHIGEGSLIGAGAHVSMDVPPNSLVVGCNIIKKTIGHADMQDVPSQWMDAGHMEDQIKRANVVVNAAQQHGVILVMG